jgi:hypothetical protein
MNHLFWWANTYSVRQHRFIWRFLNFMIVSGDSTEFISFLELDQELIKAIDGIQKLFVNSATVFTDHNTKIIRVVFGSDSGQEFPTSNCTFHYIIYTHNISKSIKKK